MLLGKVAERNNDDGGEYLCNRWKKVELFHKQFDKNVIQQNANHHQYKIPEQLYPAVQSGLSENNIPHQEKTNGKTNTERNNERGDIRLKCYEAEIEHLFLQNKIIANKKNENIQKRVRSAASSITERLHGHQFSERRIKKINKRCNKVLWHWLLTLNGAKIVQIAFRLAKYLPTLSPGISGTHHSASSEYAIFAASKNQAWISSVI